MMNVAFEEQIYSSYYLGSRRINEDEPFTKIFFRVIQEKGTHFANPFFANILFQYPHETINNDFRGYREERLG